MLRREARSKKTPYPHLLFKNIRGRRPQARSALRIVWNLWNFRAFGARKIIQKSCGCVLCTFLKFGASYREFIPSILYNLSNSSIRHTVTERQRDWNGSVGVEVGPKKRTIRRIVFRALRGAKRTQLSPARSGATTHPQDKND